MTYEMLHIDQTMNELMVELHLFSLSIFGKLVCLCDFVQGDVTLVSRDLDQASMEAVASLLAGLPLQPEESDRGDLMEAKSQLFLKSVASLNSLFKC